MHSCFKNWSMINTTQKMQDGTGGWLDELEAQLQVLGWVKSVHSGEVGEGVHVESV